MLRPTAAQPFLFCCRRFGFLLAFFLGGGLFCSWASTTTKKTTEKKGKTRQEGERTKILVFPRFWGIWGTGLAEEQANNQQKQNFLSFLASLSICLLPFLFFIPFSFLALSSSSFSFFLLPCFLCCFDSSQMGQSNKRKQGRKKVRREKDKPQKTQTKEKQEEKQKRPKQNPQKLKRRTNVDLNPRTGISEECPKHAPFCRTERFVDLKSKLCRS